MIVLDSSAAVDHLARTRPEQALWVDERVLGADSLHAPHIVDVEVLGVLRRLVARGAITDERADVARTALAELDLLRYPHVDFLERMWELRANLTAADAAFVALAEALDAELVTTDRALSRTPGVRATLTTFDP